MDIKKHKKATSTNVERGLVHVGNPDVASKISTASKAHAPPATDTNVQMEKGCAKNFLHHSMHGSAQRVKAAKVSLQHLDVASRQGGRYCPNARQGAQR